MQTITVPLNKLECTTKLIRNQHRQEAEIFNF